MALREFDGQLDAAPKLKEFTGNLDGDGQSSAIGEVTAANYLKSVKERQAKDASSATFTDNLRDVVAAALKIGPTAVKGVADIGRLTTGDTVGVDTSNAMKRGMDAIDQVIGSNALNAQKANINQALQDPNVGITDIPGVILNNPRAAADTAVSAVGSMFLPTGAAVGATKALPTIAKVFPRLAGMAPGAVATGATVGTSALQNASETFTGTTDQSLPDRYKGAAISGAASLVLGKILDGGVEGVIARRMAGESGVRGALNIANSAAKTGAKEFLQEGGEESANYIGQQIATSQPIDLNAMGKQGVYGGIVGLGVGGVADLATNLPPKQSPAQSPEPTAADYQAAVQKIFGTGQAPAAPTQQAPVSQPQAAQIAPSVPAPQEVEQAPQQAIQSLAQLITNTATQDSPLNVPKLTPVADDIKLDTETQANGSDNVLQPVDSNPVGTGTFDPASGVESVQRVLDTGKLDITGNAATEPTVRTAPLESTGQFSEPLAPATEQPAANVAAKTPVLPSQTKAITGFIGQDGTSIDEGGTPFKTKQAAQKAKKLQPMMRVKQVAGGFVLADKTPAQLAAEEKAAKRIRSANAEAGSKGKPMAAHEFIASRGGMAPSERSDLGIEGNVKIGNRWLFAGAGKGMTIAQATEALQEAGYIKEDSHNAAYDLIKRSVSNPQYTDEGWEGIAELERQTQFDDYLASQQEAAQEDNFDPFAPLDDLGYTQEDAIGFATASPELQAEMAALIEAADVEGIDFEQALFEAARITENGTQDEYTKEAIGRLETLVGAIRQQSNQEQDSQQGGQAAEPASGGNGGQNDSGQGNPRGQVEAPSEEALTSYTPQDIEDRLAKLEQAEQERKRQEKEAEQKAKADAERDTFALTGSDRAADVAASQGQQDIFSAPAQEEAQVEPTLEATPAAPAKPARKRKESTAELRAKLEDHFAVGNIIKSDYWKTDSRVLSFDWNGGNWSVTVEGVGKRDGEWVSTSSPRTHSTMFSAKDEVIERGNKPETQTETAAEAQNKIADFGQKIGGARKDVWTSFKDQLGEVVDDDIALQPLSKVWPQPDYQALLDGGTDPWTVAFIRAARDEIPAKPRQSYKVKRWAEQVKTLRSFANLIMGEKESETGTAKKFIEKSQTIKPLLGRVELYLAVGHDKSLDGMTMQENFYSLYMGEKNVTKWVIEQKTKSSSFGNWPRSVAAGDTKEEVIAKFKSLYEGLSAKDNAKKQVTFDIYSKHRVDGFFVGKKLGRNYIDLAGPFATVKEARTYKAESQDELLAKLEKVKEIPRERRDTNEPRVGEDMRNGQDVTPQMFGAAFGFRGVEFGNWVEQGRRQQDLNDAYDALMDMAAVLNIPAKAISLNGQLGLAFGARGSGGVSPAAAHYERDKVVINLTKKNGAGSLGHEWWHALDNYFSRKRSKADGMMTDALDVKLASVGSKYLYQDKGVRKEMVDAYGVVMKAINSTAIKARSAQLDGKRSKDYWTTDVEMSARAFESYLIAKLQDQNASNDYLANIVAPETWDAMAALGMQLEESYPYPTAGEIPAIRAGFDEFFKTTESRETDKGVEIYSTSKGKPVNISEHLTPSAIEEEIGYALAKFAHKPVIRVLDTAVGVLPGASDSDGISGALHDSSIYLFRDFLHSRTEVQRTFFHEMLHYGLRRFLTRDQFITQMSKLYERDSYIKKDADAWVQTEVGQRTKAAHGEKFAKARGVDEALAIFAEENRSGTLDKTVLERVRSVLTKWMAQLADYFGFKQYAADLRAVKNDEAHALINEIFGKMEVDASPAIDAWNDMKDMPFSMKGQEQQQDQTELDLGQPARNFEPINVKDAFSREVDASGRKQYVLGRKLYDRMATYATDYLGRAKLADNRPTEFKQMMRQFRVDQNKATESAKAIAEKGMDLTPEQRVLLSDMIENQVKVADVPPQEMVELAASITAALETQANELVELGMLSEERLVKDYLPRLYKTPLIAQLSNKQMFMSWFTKTRMKIRGARLQSRGLVNEVPIEKVELAKKFGWKVSSLADGDNLPQNLLDVLESGGKIPQKFNGTKIIMWRDFTQSEREDMGEVRDAVLRYAMGYVETQRDVAIGRLFKSVANNPDLAKTYNPGGWVQVPNAEIKGAPGTKTYGALAGMYVEPQVADSLKRNTQPKGVLMAAYDKALGWWKEGKTVWNPVSHGNNVVSNVFVMHFAGLNPANPANWRNTVREYRTKGQYYKEAVDKGLFGTEWATMEIQNLLLPDLADMADMESVASSRFSKMAEFLKKTGKPVSWYRENMQRAYEFEDQFFKLMIYTDRRKAGMTPEQAVEDTERYIFNYADMPEGVENIKRIYSPFFSYTYKAVPMVIHTAMHHPDRLIAPIALLAGANWLGYLISGGDEDKERKGLPDYMQGRSAIGTQKAVRMPFNVEGKPAFMDVTRRVPLGDLFDVNNQTNGLPVPAPLMPSHPLLSMTAAIAWNVDTFSGKDLVKKSDTPWEAAQTRAGYIYKQLTPNAPFVPGSYNFNKLMDSAAYTFDTEFGPYTGRTKAGDPVPLSTTLPDVLTGTKIRAVDPERGIEYKRADIAKEEREIRANIRSANRNQSMTNDSRERFNQEQRDKLDTLRTKRDALQ